MKLLKSLTITKIGNSAGVILPKEVLAKLDVEVGDQLYLTEGPDGLKVTQYDPAMEEQMEVFRKVAKRRRNALRELAK